MYKADKEQILSLAKLKNLVPGTLIYNGNRTEFFEIELYAYNSKVLHKETFSSVEDFMACESNLGDSKDLTYWLNVTGINHVDEIRKLGYHYNMNDLLLEQILTITKHNSFKIEEGFIFNDLQMVKMNLNSIEVENTSIFYAENSVITFQERAGDIFGPLRHRIENKEGYVRNENTSYLYYCMMDALVDQYLQVLEFIKLDVQDAEEAIIVEEAINLKWVHQLKKHMMMMKMNATSIDKVIEVFHKDNKHLQLTDVSFIDNLYEHSKLLVNDVALQREIVDALFENYMLYNSNEMNKVMTTLTIFSAIFIPLSFLAGIFGMNFVDMPLLTNPYGFYYFMGGCAMTTLLMIGFFKLRKWF